MIKRKAGLVSFMIVAMIVILICISGTALAGSESRNVATVIQYLDDVVHDKAYETIEEYVHPEDYSMRYLHVEGLHDGISHGHSEHKEHVKAMHGNVSDLSLTITDISSLKYICFEDDLWLIVTNPIDLRYSITLSFVIFPLQIHILPLRITIHYVLL